MWQTRYSKWESLCLILKDLPVIHISHERMWQFWWLHWSKRARLNIWKTYRAQFLATATAPSLLQIYIHNLKKIFCVGNISTYGGQDMCNDLTTEQRRAACGDSIHLCLFIWLSPSQNPHHLLLFIIIYLTALLMFLCLWLHQNLPLIFSLFLCDGLKSACWINMDDKLSKNPEGQPRPVGPLSDVKSLYLSFEDFSAFFFMLFDLAGLCDKLRSKF